MDNLFNKLRETTDSSAIAYTPGSLFGDISPDVITPIVPGLNNDPDVLRNRKRRKQMREAIDSKIGQMQIDIVQALKNVAFASKLTYKQYVQTFNYTKDLTPPNILIDVMKKDADLNLIAQMLGEDIGELELILTAIQQNKPLSKFEAFQKYDYLAGCRLQSLPIPTVTFIYEGVLDQQYIERETIAVSDPDICKILQERVKNKIITSGKWARVFPIDKWFDTNFYSILKEVTLSDFDGQGGGEEDGEQSEEETE